MNKSNTVTDLETNKSQPRREEGTVCGDVSLDVGAKQDEATSTEEISAK
jgi:hypothetical protein